MIGIKADLTLSQITHFNVSSSMSRNFNEVVILQQFYQQQIIEEQYLLH